MKKIVYLFGPVLLLLGSRAASAQAIANLNLETWGTRNGVEAPANWQTFDDVLAFERPGSTFDTKTTTKSTDAHSGSFAAQLTNTTFNGTQGPFVQEGVLIVGQKLSGNVTANGYPIGGAPYSGRPTQLQFYYKFTGLAADSAIVTLLLTKKSSVPGKIPDLVGGGTITLDPTRVGYVSLTADIPYFLPDRPDSIRLQFISGTSRIITSGATLLVDDISLIGGVLPVRADAGTQAQLTVSPNPSPAGHFHLSAPNQPALASAAYAVLDLTGRVVAQQPALAVPSPTRELDLSNLSTGIYLLRVDSKQGALVRQLVVK